MDVKKLLWWEVQVRMGLNLLPERRHASSSSFRSRRRSKRTFLSGVFACMSGFYHLHHLHQQQQQQQPCSFFKSFDWRRAEDLMQSEERFDRFIIPVIVVEQSYSFWSPMPFDFGSLHRMWMWRSEF